MKSINIGFIPDNWSGNVDGGGDRIDIGSTEFSNTIEIQFKVEDNKFEFDDLILDYDKTVNNTYSELIKLVEYLKVKNNWTLLTNKSLSTAFKTIQGLYWPINFNGTIKFISSKGPEIVDAPNYKSCFYINCWDEDEESDITVIFK